MSLVDETLFNTLPVIADANQQGTLPALQSGDILISHRHAGKGKWEKPYHASIIVIPTDNEVTFVLLYESHPESKGVRALPWSNLDDDCTVFRPWGSDSAAQDGADAALQAEAFRAAHVGYSSAKVGRAIMCGYGGRKFYGPDAYKRLEKYRGRATKAPKNCVCSEYVVLCYQMALKQGGSHFILLDAKHAAPWDLEDYLMINNNVSWKLVGAAKGRPKPKK